MPLKAAILLGANCGFGNHDLSVLPVAALDLEARWVRFPRPKTGIDRRCPLWPETVAAIREGPLQSDRRPSTRPTTVALFLSPRGSGGRIERSDNNIGKAFGELLKGLGLNRPGRAFYALRHTFETIAGWARVTRLRLTTSWATFPTATDMSAVYREGIEDARLVAVVEHVRTWLFGTETK